MPYRPGEKYRQGTKEFCLSAQKKFARKKLYEWEKNNNFHFELCPHLEMFTLAHLKMFNSFVCFRFSTGLKCLTLVCGWTFVYYLCLTYTSFQHLKCAVAAFSHISANDKISLTRYQNLNIHPTYRVFIKYCVFSKNSSKLPPLPR